MENGKSLPSNVRSLAGVLVAFRGFLLMDLTSIPPSVNLWKKPFQ